jgi:hypothetical protein
VTAGAVADAGQSAASGAGLVGGLTGALLRVRVALRDAFGNALARATARADVAVEVGGAAAAAPLDPSEAEAVVVATYSRASSGAVAVSVTVGSEHVPGSPFLARVVAARDAGAPLNASLCFAEGRALHLATAGAAGTFAVTAVDAAGVPFTRGGAAFVAWLARAAGGARVDARVSDRGDGSYAVEYTATAAGAYGVFVRVSTFGGANGAEVSGSPFALRVRAAGLAAAGSRVRGAALLQGTAGAANAFEIEARDAFGNRRAWAPPANEELRAAPPFAVRAAGPGGAAAVALSDRGDGSWGARYAATLTGRYTLAVALAATGERVGGAPEAGEGPDVAPGPASAASSSVSSGGLTHATAGGAAVFRLLLRDAFGHRKALSPALAARLQGDSAPVLLEQLPDGAVLARVTPTAAGARALLVSPSASGVRLVRGEGRGVSD